MEEADRAERGRNHLLYLDSMSWERRRRDRRPGWSWCTRCSGGWDTPRHQTDWAAAASIQHTPQQKLASVEPFAFRAAPKKISPIWLQWKYYR